MEENAPTLINLHVEESRSSFRIAHSPDLAHHLMFNMCLCLQSSVIGFMSESRVDLLA